MGPFLSFMMRNRITGPSQIGGLFRQMTLHSENITSDIVDGYWRSLSEGTTHAFLAFAKGFPW
jgi:hypothetical protein